MRIWLLRSDRPPEVRVSGGGNLYPEENLIMESVTAAIFCQSATSTVPALTAAAGRRAPAQGTCRPSGARR
jgi:hypothetical protein